MRPTVERLRLAQSAIITSAFALRHQNADCDTGVAHVLLRGATDPLEGEIERIEELLRTLGGEQPKEPIPECKAH